MKHKFSLNNRNQLVLESSRVNEPVEVRGSFSLDEDNQLVYWLNETQAWRKRYNLADKVCFVGNWELNSNYDLELNLEKTKNQYCDERLLLQGEIISTDRDTLVFEMISQDKEGQSHIQLLKLTGRFRADEYNQITFSVKKKASPDELTFTGSWQINKNQQVTYAYRKRWLKRKSGVSRVLTFEGFWQINSLNKLTYILANSSVSYFDFRVQIESPNLYPKDGSIKYRVGTGLKVDKPSQMVIICLYGSWKFSRRAGISFSMDYGDGRVRDIEFGADVCLNKKDEITFSLANNDKVSLGLDITFKHAFIKKEDAQAFLRLKDVLNKNESTIEAGVRIPF